MLFCINVIYVRSLIHRHCLIVYQRTLDKIYFYCLCIIRVDKLALMFFPLLFFQINQTRLKCHLASINQMNIYVRTLIRRHFLVVYWTTQEKYIYIVYAQLRVDELALIFSPILFSLINQIEISSCIKVIYVRHQILYLDILGKNIFIQFMHSQR